MTVDQPHLTRDERRRRTEAAILTAAREIFADAGYERTTIRAVAGRVGVDPALVMQYFGSKEGLFAAASRWHDLGDSVRDATAAQVPEAVLADFFRLEAADNRDALIALMRSCLTHPAAAQVMREQVMCDRAEVVSGKIDAEDARLRAALVGACLMGLGMSRYLLEVEPLASAAPEQISRLLAPALRALVDPS